MGENIAVDFKCEKCTHDTCIIEYSYCNQDYNVYCASPKCNFVHLKQHKMYGLAKTKCAQCKRGHMIIAHDKDNFWNLYCVIPTCQYLMIINENWVVKQYRRAKQCLRFAESIKDNENIELSKKLLSQYKDIYDCIQDLKD